MCRGQVLQLWFFFFKKLMILFYLFFIVVQVQLSPSSHHYFPGLTHPQLPPPPSILAPFGFVHVSRIHVPWWPPPFLPLPLWFLRYLSSSALWALAIGRAVAVHSPWGFANALIPRVSSRSPDTALKNKHLINTCA